MNVNRIPAVDAAAGIGRVRSALAKVAASAYLSIGLFALFALSYLLTLTRWYTYDAVSYALQIRRFAETGALDKFLHPHHLLFNPLGFVAWRLLSAANPAMESLTALQVMNAVFGALGVALTFIVLRDGGLAVRGRRRSEGVFAPTHAFAAALALGCANGYWIAATDGRVNMPGLVALVLGVALMWGMLERPSWWQCGACAAASVLAVGLHQSHGLILVAGVGCMLCAQSALKERLGFAAAYLGMAMAAITLMYLAAGSMAGQGGIGGVVGWSLAYARDGRWWSFGIARNLAEDVDALTHVFVTRLPTVSEGAASLWTAGLGIAMSIIAQLLLLLVVIGVVLQIRAGTRSGDGEWRKMLVLALVAVPYAAFFTVWNPGYFVFWLPPALAMVMCVGLLMQSLSAGTRGVACIALVMWTIACAATNLDLTLARRTRAASNPMLEMARGLGEQAAASDLVVVTGAGYQAAADVYLPYFAGTRVLSLNKTLKDADGDEDSVVRTTRDEITRRIASGGRVIVLNEIDSREAWRGLSRTYGVSTRMRERILDGFVRTPLGLCGSSRAYLLQSFR